REAEFGRPQWAFAMSCYAFVDEDSILCRYGVAGFDRLARLDLESGRLDDLPLDYTWVDGVRVEGSLACFLGASPTRAAEVVTLDLVGGNATPVRSSLGFDLDSAELSRPESIEFVSAGGRKAYAFFYPPVSGRFEPAPGERPPLLVKSHGGPTAAASPALDLGIQYWTSRGFGVVDVNYGGSTGYGRAYRDRLLGQWGVVDVEDCIHAALHLADAGRVDRERLAIRGGSAGGYTVLCALTFHDVFAAGASHYGIGDLEALDRDTHKFESRYTQQLVAPDPEGEGREVYRARSPIHAADRLSCPVIFFQGLDDPIVPPSQAEAMAKALERRGIPHALVLFEGERHGFQRAENIRTALDGELYFYSQVFGFEVDVPTHVVDAVRIVGGSPAA
ncbi:MAG: prolyl oligopeptidase family serine peptidase, partial [Proteobacteria bacterium]|nr:prolyl oligopeptidase family serine peptidase [Pseudomonadota bacterium]